MRVPAILLAVISAAGCIQPAFTQTDRTDAFASCRAMETCAEGGEGSDLVVPIVLGTALVGVVAFAMHRYVIADDD